MRNRKTLFSSLFIALFLCTIPQIFAADLHVSNASGNDGNDGSSWGLAKKTIMAAVTAASSGDNILIEGGIYQEQVVIGNKSLNITGSLNSGGTRTVINAPAWGTMTAYPLPSDLVWNGAGKLSGTSIKPIVFVNATSASWTININGIDINGSTAGMQETDSEIFTGLAHRFALGTIGGSGANYIEVRNIKPTLNSNALNNTAGILFLTRSKPTLQYARVHNYRNVGIGVIGYNTSNLISIREDQPYPTIQDCIVTGENGGTSSTSEDAIQAGILIANGGHCLVRRSHIHGNRSAASGGNRLAYGVYLYDARTVLVGDNVVKENGNVIEDNEMAIYVRVITTSLPATLYSFRHNNIVYNGGSTAGLGTASGKIASYGSTIAVNTTYGIARFSHANSFTNTLDLRENAFGNSEADLFYSYTPTHISVTDYLSAPYAFWRETSNDIILYDKNISAPVATNLSVNATHKGSNTSGAPVVDVAYGYTNFEQINKAVYAAQLLSVGTIPPRINVASNVVENESIIITKPIKIMGSGSSCDAYPSVTLRSGINEPVIWFYGLSVGVNNLDALNRTPMRDTVFKIRILANDVQAASANPAGAPAVLFTGNTNGDNAPFKPVLSFMSISNEFDGITSPQAYSTSQTGTSTLTKRWSKFASGPYSVKYTRRPENCSTLVGDPNVIDWTDNNQLARLRFDNNIYVADCIELNAAIAAAEGPDPTSIIVTTTIPPTCDAIVNTTETIIMDVQAGATANVHFLLNPGTGPGYGGGSRQVCAFTSNVISGGTLNTTRVTVYPPACLQTAIDLITPGATNVLVAADGAISTLAPFTDASPVTIAKQFDFRGATSTTAHLALPTAGNATYSGTFRLNGGADIQGLTGTLTSTKGTTFGSSINQVELNFSSSTLSNYGAPGDAIEMSLQLIGTSGSRRLELLQANHTTETPTINKRVYVNGLTGRGTTVGTTTLSGSGNCTDPSVLRNLNLANAIVNSDADCIQTALGLAGCTTYTQDIEGVGTNSTNGSGGTVDLNNVAYTQNIDIAKSVTFTNKLSTTGTVTLRKGAAVTGLNNFTNTVNLEQCVSFAGASHPNPEDGIAIANTTTGVVNIAGYGAADASTGNGVWSFSNINVNKDVEIRGNYHSTSASDLTCALLAGSSLPLVNPLIRIPSSETVIGTFDGSTLTVTNPIFKVTTSGPSIKGFTVRNVGTAVANALVRIDGASSNVEVTNNIVTGSVTAGNVIGLVNDNNAGTKSNIDVSDNHVSTTGLTHSAIYLRDLNNGAGIISSISNNVINGQFVNQLAVELSNFTNNANSGITLSNNWVKSSLGTGLKLTSVGPNTLNGIIVERNNFRESGSGVFILTATATGSNGITIRENYINNNGDGIYISGNLTPMTTNQIFINNNNLASNSHGVFIQAITSNSAPTTNILDLRFNWWGSDLGPARGSTVASAPSFAGSDSLNVIGHVPFTHSGVGISKIEDVNGSTHGRWMVYPSATTAVDGNSACGWQFNDMMLAVIRVNSADNTLLGNYTTITAARHNTGNTSDQLYILGPASYNSTSYGYPSGATPEPVYPVVFSVAGQPSKVKGLTYPTINVGNNSGSIQVASTFPVGFTISNYIKHISDAGIHTVLSFANPFGNTVRNNYMTSNTVTPSSYTGISIVNGVSSEAHTIENNRINLTDGGTGEAWPGSASVTTTSSVPVTFVGISLTSNATLSPINVTCNDIIAQSTSGSKGIVYSSALATTGVATIENNNIRTMSTGVEYNFTSPYGFSSAVTAKGNYIVNGIRGVQFNGSLVSMATNTMFVNNNDLSGNSVAGVDVAAATSNTAPTSNMLDLRFNWWGSNLGPVRGTNVTNTPSLITSDSLNIIGHVPFTHTGAGISKIEDAAATQFGRWMIYPAATVATDANGVGCGWQYTHMMPAVIRVNAARNSILGAYSTITQGRDGTTSAFGITDGARNTTDELFVLGPSSYGVATFGYPTTAGHETYPITFSAAGQPSTIKGLTYPTINTGGTAQQTIFVDETFPAGFSILDYIKYISSAANHTVLVFKNNAGNTVKNNYMTSNNATPTSYKGIEILRGLAGQTHTIQDNKINLTDGSTGEAWPGSANITTTASTPTTFIGIRYHCSTAANLNVTCNDIIANSTTGSTGIEYCSDVAPSGTVNIEANNIRSMGSGIHYTFNVGYGFTNNITTKENFIVNGVRGILFNGTLAPMITNRVFVNNNNLSGNTIAGIDINATTSRTVATTNMLDLRFNWWGSNLGPVKGLGVSNAPDFAGTDSLNIIGHVPFTHATGSSIVDNNGTTHGRWMVYPVAITSTDATPIGCGWQYNDMMPAVLRVDATAGVLLGGYAKIDEGRTNSNNVSGITAGARNTTDQLYILGPSTYGVTFGYPSAPGTPHETYPIVFNAANEPSAIRGLTYPTINTGNTPGAIRVGSSFPAGFSVLDYIKHFTTSSSHDVLVFENPFGNTVRNNFFASNNLSPTRYVGINMSAGAVGQSHIIQSNRINLTDGFDGETWPGAANITTPNTTGVSNPSEFIGVLLNGTAGASNINVSCNHFIANQTNGTKGIVYTSDVANSGSVNIQSNSIRKMGVGVNFTFNTGFGFTNTITTKENFIINGDNGVLIAGTTTGNTANKVFVNNNNLSGNITTGIYLQAVMPDNEATSNFLDFRFNWWGSELGPTRSGGVPAIPSMAPTDSVLLRGHIPFTHTSASMLAEIPPSGASSARSRWMIYPNATSGVNSNTSGSCGWYYSQMMGSVLRVNSAGNTLLGMYSSIQNGRDDSPASGQVRTSTDQLFVIAQSTYEAGVFGYNGATSNEGSYPVVFSASPEPTTIRGINRPRILEDGTIGTGSIRVTSAYTTNFVVKDYIEHVAKTSNTYVGLNFENNGNNVAENNFITSTQANPTSFTGIRVTNSSATLSQRIDSNRIKLASNPRWPSGPAIAGSAPETFIGIDIPSHGATGLVQAVYNDISVANLANTKSTGIYTNSSNLSLDIRNNTIYGMAAIAGWATRTDHWGTGIYLRTPVSYRVNSNNIQGGNGIGTKGHDGITIDRGGVGFSNELTYNTISTLSPLSGINMSGNRERGYGIKLYSSDGTGAFGPASISSNTFGSLTSTAPGVASIFIGGTSGAIANPIVYTVISANDIRNGVESANASIQIATTQYSGISTGGGYIEIFGNGIGSTTSGLSNAMFLAIGTDGFGGIKNANADNYEVNVVNNIVRTSQQTVGGSTIEVSDGRPNRGENIRNIFGYVDGLTYNGSGLGSGFSGRNTFTHAAILTGETGLADYTTTMTRTGNAIAYPASTDPVVISRLIASPLGAARSTETMNTVEIRESAGWVIGSENLYYKETLTFPDHRILINGPRSSYAQLLPGAGGTGTMFTSNGRENKDIRGSITFNTIGAGMYGRVSVGAPNKGDVYLQMDAVGSDSKLLFNHHATDLVSLSSITRLQNTLDRTLDIKAGMDDADDDNYVANTTTTRRTGVFRSGTSTSQFLKETQDAVAGTELMNVFPNPASGDVTVAFKVPVEGMIRVALYDAMGRKVTDLREEYLNIDTYSTTFNAADLPSGTYHVRLMHDLFTVTTSVSVIK
jgi:hypothetical protein